MAAGNTLLTLRPQEAYPEGGGNPAAVVGVGLASGIAFNPLTDAGAVFITRLPATAALATGATISLIVADDPLNPSVGKVARFGVNFKKLASGTDTVDATGLGTEGTVDLTLPGTAGVVLVGSVAIVVANMDGLAAGDWCLLRVRRIGTHANDTHRGRVVLLGIDVRDT